MAANLSWSITGTCAAVFCPRRLSWASRRVEWVPLRLSFPGRSEGRHRNVLDSTISKSGPVGGATRFIGWFTFPPPDHCPLERRILSSVSDCLLNVSKDALHSRLLIANCRCHRGSCANLEIRSRASSEPRSLALSYQVRASARSGMIPCRSRNPPSTRGS